MKVRPNLLWLAVSGLCLVGFQLPTSTSYAAEPAAAPVEQPTWLMSVNGQSVSTETFNIFFGERLRQMQAAPSPQTQNQVIGDLINLTLLAADARQRGMDKQPDVQAALKLQEDQMLTRLAVQEIAGNAKPSDEEIKKAYDAEYANRSGLEYKAKHIMSASEDEAKELIKKLDGGAKYADLATPRGKDSGSEDLGWINPADVVPPFAEAVKAMKPGTHSKQPVKTDFGWHVILLEETREVKPPALEDVKAELVATLQQQAAADYLKALREKAKIEFNPALTKAPEAAPSSGTKPADKK